MNPSPESLSTAQFRLSPSLKPPFQCSACRLSAAPTGPLARIIRSPPKPPAALKFHVFFSPFTAFPDDSRETLSPEVCHLISSTALIFLSGFGAVIEFEVFSHTFLYFQPVFFRQLPELLLQHKFLYRCDDAGYRRRIE